MSRLFLRATQFATTKHEGQTRWDKKTPYITHPLAVAELILEQEHPEWMAAAAVLHDVIEDTDATYIDLEKAFGKQIADTVLCLSKHHLEDYYPFILRIMKHEAARIIKLADLEHNLSDLNPKSNTMRAKYQLAQHVLGGAGPHEPEEMDEDEHWDFQETVLGRIHKGLSDQEVFDSLDPDTRGSDLVAFIRIMEDKGYDGIFPAGDMIAYLEMAGVVLDVHPDTLAQTLDYEDGELDRLAKQLKSHMDEDGALKEEA